jgi:hypothetical protein
MDNWVARQHALLQVAQAHQHQSDSHLLVEYDLRITEYPIHSYVLFTPSVGRGNKLLPKHRGPFQVLDKTDSIYIIEDLVSGKRITTHIHNLRPFIYDPIRTNPLTVAQHNEQEFIVESIDDPPCNSTSDGLDSTSPATAGNHTRPSCMWTSSFHEDAHSTGAQVATENFSLSQDFPRLFPALSWLVFPLDF